jgi:hypothetical protein
MNIWKYCGFLLISSAIILLIALTIVSCNKKVETISENEEEMQYIPLPMWQEFQQRVNTNLITAYKGVDLMWDSYFPNPPANLPTLNKSAVYYDATKVLLELSELWGTNATQDMYDYAVKAAQIYHAYYTTRVANSIDGFVRFPHGLVYLYRKTGEQFYKEALEACAAKSNWASEKPVNERTAYSREVSYAISVYIATIEANMSFPNVTELLSHFTDMALSHLNQWHSGVFYNPADNFRQPFMVGLTMNALIEYYEKIEKDPRIPAAIKETLDDLWEQSWGIIGANTPGGNYSVYTPGYGAFWYWADYENGKWVNDINRMPTSLNLNPDNNMIVGAAYAWYARWVKDFILFIFFVFQKKR